MSDANYVLGKGANDAYFKVQFRLSCRGNLVIVLAVHEEDHEISISGRRMGSSCIHHIAKSCLFHLATNMQKLQSLSMHKTKQ
jgi:hypothetical protein